MFLKESERAEAYVAYLKRVFTDLYNGLPDEEQYTYLRKDLLQGYQDVEAGWNPVPIVQKLLGDINQVYLLNLKQHETNPDVVKTAEKQLRNANEGATSHRWISDYAFLFNIMDSGAGPM
ncbi:hypothetical protein [Weissella uvarum]|nr:hypothetical protein [Weissella uvarum]